MMDVLPHANVSLDDLQYLESLLQYALRRCGIVESQTDSSPKGKRTKRGGNTFSMSQLCTRHGDIVENCLFPFLDLKDHLSLARTSVSFLKQGGLPAPSPPSPPRVIKHGPWKKKVRLPSITSDDQLRRFCTYAAGAHILLLSGCDGLTDVAALGNTASLHTLDLSDCEGLTDVSGLGNIASLNTLNLSDCEGLTDVSGLGNIGSLHTLMLSNCVGLTDVSALGNLASLYTLKLS
jgi:hypothetical protein